MTEYLVDTAVFAYALGGPHRQRVACRRVVERAVAGELCTVHTFGPAVLTRALDLVASTQLRGRDAVHAATVIENGLAAILTPDTDFDGVAGLDRISPEALS